VRAVLVLIAAVCLVTAAWTARARGSSAPDADEPVVVGEARVRAADLEAAAERTRPDRIAAARRAAADRAIERLWLAGEAAARGLRPAADLSALRAQVADTLAGPRPLPGAVRFAAAFDRFHERWRARTRCLPAYRDPYGDRCGDVAPAAAGACRWMGEATVCTLAPGARRRWLVVAPRAQAVRLRTRADALAVARVSYARARAARDPAAEVAERDRRMRERQAAAERAAAERDRRAREREAAEERAAAERLEAAARAADEREARRREPRLTGPALAGARVACARQARESDPYLFGFGLQDVVGQAEGLVAVRAALAERLVAAARDDVDRDKLRPRLAAIRDGSGQLVRIARAAGDQAAVDAFVARFDARTGPERASARRLGLGDCLVRPAR
jgi:hypothetical protein